MYADSTAVLGPLATYAEPHCYDLCAIHAERLTVPRGWEVMRLALPEQPPIPNTDDLMALAKAVRQAGTVPDNPDEAPAQRGLREPIEPPSESGGARRGHLRILRGQQ